MQIPNGAWPSFWFGTNTSAMVTITPAISIFPTPGGVTYTTTNYDITPLFETIVEHPLKPIFPKNVQFSFIVPSPLCDFRPVDTDIYVDYPTWLDYNNVT